MKDTIRLMKDFEKRNNISITLMLQSDESGNVKEFWDGEELKEFETIDELHSFLRDTQYRLCEKDGRCFSPVQVV